jgi:hypothetical protein
MELATETIYMRQFNHAKGRVESPAAPVITYWAPQQLKIPAVQARRWGKTHYLL